MNAPAPRKIPKIENTIQELESVYRKFEVEGPFHQLHTQMTSSKYLDEAGKFSVVLSTHLNKVEQSNNKLLEENSRLRQDLMQSKADHGIDRVLMQQWKQKSNDLADNCAKLNKVIASQKEAYQELERRYKELNEKKIQSVCTRVNKVQILPSLVSHLKQYTSQQIQTEYWLPKIEINRIEVVQQSPTKKKTESEQRVEAVVRQLESYLSSISEDVSKTLHNIQDQHLSLKDVIEKNDQLTKENQKLRSQVEQFDLQKEKFRVWREQVEGRMSELMRLADTAPTAIIIEGEYEDYQPKSTIEVGEENKYLKGQIKKLRDKLLKLELDLNAEKLKAKMDPRKGQQPEAPEQAESGQIEEDLNFQKVVRNLSELSHKLKTVAAYLLQS